MQTYGNLDSLDNGLGCSGLENTRPATKIEFPLTSHL